MDDKEIDNGIILDLDQNESKKVIGYSCEHCDYTAKFFGTIKNHVM